MALPCGYLGHQSRLPRVTSSLATPLDSGASTLFLKGSENEYFRFCRPISLCCNYWTLP